MHSSPFFFFFFFFLLLCLKISYMHWDKTFLWILIIRVFNAIDVISSACISYIKHGSLNTH
ncbi:uncharacterized protein EV154DRAFT_510719 [Mucor mucedo]|uniref:uncharacterized protein n=1 Tax=Mucor mucedo TaxID=29922 RepID=UPI002220DE83|nr:uncharacterized protein EV154DRAFT_510719 [Mucor mucedo]KAI7890707.1 hypothetical protein EV154DRAFT_510719 [Mucor mucedo]